MLQHNPTFVGISRFVSPAVDLTGKNNVVVSFKHYLDNYSGSHTIGIATTSDGGATWNDAWSETYNVDGRYEVRQIVGMRPSEDPRADELRNSNMPTQDEEPPAMAPEETDEDTEE